LILDAIHSSEVLMHVIHLTEHHIEHLVENARSKTVPVGEYVTRAGDKGEYSADGTSQSCSFYIVHDGVLEVKDRDPMTGDRMEKRLRNGDTFGEMALIDGKYSETVVAVRHCILWELDKACFAEAVQEAFEIEHEQYTQLLEKVPTLSNYLAHEDLILLAGDLQVTYFTQGDLVVRGGNVAIGLHIVQEGQCETADGVTYAVDACVGEEALLGKESAQSIKVTSSVFKTLYLPTQAIEIGLVLPF
jgi:CRP-like cAMP-binding protein